MTYSGKFLPTKLITSFDFFETISPDNENKIFLAQCLAHISTFKV
jgi:hypothetical protein